MASSFLTVCRFNPTTGSTTDWTFSTAVTGFQSPTAAGVVNGTVYSYRAESLDLSQWEIGIGAYNTGTGVLARTTVLFNSAGGTSKINFTLTPQVAIIATADDIRYIPKAVDYGGRLTSLSAAPVPTVDVVGSQNLYYAPYKHKMVPTYTSGVWTLRQFTSSSSDQVGQTLALAGSANWPVDTLHDVFEVMDSGVAKMATRQWDAGMLWTEALITPSTSLASGGAAGYITTGTTSVTWGSPGTAFDGTPNKAAASSASNLQTTNTFAGANAICTFLGQDWGSGVTNVVSKVVITAPNDGFFCGGSNAAYTLQIEVSNNGTDWHRSNITRYDDTVGVGGVFTTTISLNENLPCRMIKVGFDSSGASNVRSAQIQFYKKVAPTAGRRLTYIDGIQVNDAIIGSGTSPNNPMRTGASTTITTAANEGIFLGTIHINTSTAGQITQHVVGGPSRVSDVWNAQNQVPLILTAYSFAPVVGYSPVTTQRWNLIESAVSGGGGITIQVVIGLAEGPIKAILRRNVYLNCGTNAASYEGGIGVDSTSTFSGMEASCNTDSTGQAIGYMPTGMCTVPPLAGNRNLYGLERQGNNATGVQSASTGPRNSYFTAEWMG
jgi:hypothetical protein